MRRGRSVTYVHQSRRVSGLECLVVRVTPTGQPYQVMDEKYCHEPATTTLPDGTPACEAHAHVQDGEELSEYELADRWVDPGEV